MPPHAVQAAMQPDFFCFFILSIGLCRFGVSANSSFRPLRAWSGAGSHAARAGPSVDPQIGGKMYLGTNGDQGFARGLCGLVRAKAASSPMLLSVLPSGDVAMDGEQKTLDDEK